MTKNKKNWALPWGYIESIIITSGILIYGILLDIIIKTNAPVFKYPINIILFILFSGLLIFIFIRSKKNHSLKWLYSVPAAISAISLFSILSLIIALVPQHSNSGFFIYRIISSWLYLISYIYLLVILGLIVLKRTIPLKKRNIGFIINHFGLWLALLSAGLGSGDIQKLNMTLKEHEMIWYAFDEKEQYKELTFALKLTDFDMEEYNPKLALIDNNTGKIIKNRGKLLFIEITDSLNMEIEGYKIKVKRFYREADKVGSTYLPVYDIGTTPAAQIEINNGQQEGWIASGSIYFSPEFIKMDEIISLVMIKPEPKRFYSEVVVYRNMGEKYKEIIEVNKPLKIDGWKIYQTSYDEKMGKWSEISILQLVHDPWLPLVYAGCVLMIIGAIYLILTGKNRND